MARDGKLIGGGDLAEKKKRMKWRGRSDSQCITIHPKIEEEKSTRFRCEHSGP
jgi:hypothetical protein